MSGQAAPPLQHLTCRMAGIVIRHDNPYTYRQCGVRFAPVSLEPFYESDCQGRLRGSIETMKTELLDEAKRLSVEERIELVEAIWDSVAEDASVESLPVSEAHREELDRRLADWRDNPETASPGEEALDRLKRR